MASKGGREKIKLESTAGTGHFYTTSKNKKTMPEKMSIMKFDPKTKAVTILMSDFYGNDHRCRMVGSGYQAAGCERMESRVCRHPALSDEG